MYCKNREIEQTPINNDDIAIQSRPFVPANTIKKTEWAKHLYNSWRCSAQVNAEEEECNILRKDLLSLTDDEILLLFPKFVMYVRRKDNGEYKDDTIFSIISAIQKFCEINGRTVSRLSDPQFASLRNLVSNKMREKAKQGVGLFRIKG
jgi:hypothetical protein